MERYGATLDLPEMTFPQMERYLREKSSGERAAAGGRGRSGEAATLKGRGGHERLQREGEEGVCGPAEE